MAADPDRAGREPVLQCLAAVAARVVEAAARRPSSVELDAVVAVLMADHGVGPAPGPPPPAPRRTTPGGAADGNLGGSWPRLAALARTAALSPLEVDVLLLALAPDLDATLGTAIALLRGDPGRTRLSVGLTLELARAGSLDVRARAAVSPGSALEQAGLLEVVGDTSFLLRSLQVPDRVTAHLLGDDTPDPAVADVLVEAVPLPLDATRVLARGLLTGARLAWVREPSGGAGLSLAAGALAALDAPALTADLRLAPRSPGALAALVRPLVREATLCGAGLVLTGADRLAEEEPTALRRLQDAAVPVVLVGRRLWDPAWLTDLPLAVDAPVPEPALRAQLWQQLLEDVPGMEAGDEDAPRLGSQDLTVLRVTPEEIVRIARAAAEEAAARAEPLGLATVRATARRLGGAGVRGAAAGPGGAGFGDLVLPPQTIGALHEMVSWARHRDEVLSQGPVGGADGRGRGISALFSGGPGTGKTLAASVIAGELGLDLQTVELSAVVDKYIGETEKNLERVFREAEALNVLLFFDEADALFGSRSEVRDARDRYANQEVAYLLQRMEAFHGIAVLATNLRGNLDDAFSRRLQFIVHFPDPDQPTRQRLWERHLAALAGLDSGDPVDVGLLARRIELTGGEIRNVVLAAAYAAASAGRPVGMGIVVAAAEREYRKLGRRLPERGFAG